MRTKCRRPRVDRREKEGIVRMKVNTPTEGLKDAVVSIGCGDLEKSDKVSKTKRERDSTEQVAARNWATERTTVPLREAELGGE